MAKAKAIILRGLPGSGKSYLASHYYQSVCHLYSREQVVFSTDRFFYQQGQYNFTPELLPQYHAQNVSDFISALADRVSLVICDNTNIHHWEYLAYQTAAKALGYEVSVEVVGEPHDPTHQLHCYQRNQHAVSLSVIQQMGKAFQF